jgi:diacylglycerol kinase family enzyme
LRFTASRVVNKPGGTGRGSEPVKHLFVINPRSFPAAADLDAIQSEIEGCFADREEDHRVLLSWYPRNAISLIRNEAVPPGETLRVYAVGGDGILFDCLNGIVGLPNAELASVPYGNANDLIRAFGENKRGLFQDLKLQASSPAIPTDIISCGNNYALNFCSIGMESDAVMTSVKMYNNIAGKARQFRRLNFFLYTMIFYLGGIKAVFNPKVLRQYYTITVDGEDFSGVYGSINIANGPCYGGNKNPVITALPDDGELDALFFHCTASFTALGMIVPYLKGGFRRFPEYFTWKRLRKIDIRSEDPLLVNLDGEVFFDTRLSVEIIPQAVKFVAPGGAGYVRRAEA